MDPSIARHFDWSLESLTDCTNLQQITFGDCFNQHIEALNLPSATVQIFGEYSAGSSLFHWMIDNDKLCGNGSIAFFYEKIDILDNL